MGEAIRDWEVWVVLDGSGGLWFGTVYRSRERAIRAAMEHLASHGERPEVDAIPDSDEVLVGPFFIERKQLV
jgi:hypothetical protein